MSGAVLFRRSGPFWAFVRGAFAWTRLDQTGIQLTDEQRDQVAWSPLPARPETLGHRKNGAGLGVTAPKPIVPP